MTELSNELKQQGLLAFCQATTWQPEAEGTDVAQASVVCDGETFELIARSYRNLGDGALKIVFYRQTDERPRYVGAIGYHPGSTPYAKTPGSLYSEAALYEMLLSSSAQ